MSMDTLAYTPYIVKHLTLTFEFLRLSKLLQKSDNLAIQSK